MVFGIDFSVLVCVASIDAEGCKESTAATFEVGSLVCSWLGCAGGTGTEDGDRSCGASVLQGAWAGPGVDVGRAPTNRLAEPDFIAKPSDADVPPRCAAVGAGPVFPAAGSALLAEPAVLFEFDDGDPADDGESSAWATAAPCAKAAPIPRVSAPVPSHLNGGLGGLWPRRPTRPVSIPRRTNPASR